MAFGKKKEEKALQIQEAVLETVQEESLVSYGDGSVPAPVPKKKRKWGKIVMLVLVVLLAVWFGLSTLLSALKGPPPTYVETITAEVGVVQRLLSTSGTVASARSQTVYSPVTAPVEELGLTVGSVVNSGETVIRFETTDLARGVQQASANASVTRLQNQQQVEASDKNVQEARDAQASVDNLKDQKRIALERLETAGNELAEVQGQLAAAQAEMDALQKAEEPDEARLAALTAQIGELQVRATEVGNLVTLHTNDVAYHEGLIGTMEQAKTVAEAGVLNDTQRAAMQAGTVPGALSLEAAQEALAFAEAGVAVPFTGVVTGLSVEEGMLASQYAPLFTIESMEEIEVKVSLSKYDLETVREGQSVTITTRGNIYNGIVSHIDRMATQSVNASGTASGYVQATVRVLDPDDEITLGLDANLNIETGTDTGSIALPINAVNTDITGSYCFIMENGVAVRRDVTVGISGANGVAVTGGLSVGDEVIISSQNITEGMSVSTDPQYYTAANLALFG